MHAAVLPFFLLSFQAGALGEPRRLEELILPLLDEGGLPALGAALVTPAGLEAIGAVGLRFELPLRVHRGRGALGGR